MADSGTPEVHQFPELAASAAVVGTALAAGGGVLLSGAELKEYSSRSPALGWRFTVAFENGDVRRFDLIIDAAFPYTSPRVALVDRPPFLTWPHVEEDGMLCIPADGARVDNPVHAVNAALSEAVALVEDSMAGRTAPDFDREFYSYWNRLAEPIRCYSLLRLEPPLRRIRIAARKGLHVVGEDDSAVVEWLRNYMAQRDAHIPTEAALFVWLDSPLRPKDYPYDVDGALRLLRIGNGAEAEGQIFELLSRQTSRLTVVLGFATQNGNAAAVVRLPAPHGKVSGFRAGTVPAAVLKSKYERRAVVTRQRIERVDSLWIHGRDNDPEQIDLQRSTLIAVGCGSVGAPALRLLVASGVADLSVVDDDYVEPSNISRSVFGAQDIGLHKAAALAKKLTSEFPHARVKFRNERLEHLLVSEPALFVIADVIFSATASWHAELMLNAWHIQSARVNSIVYAWLEPHAAVGHVVVIGAEGGCLRCGYNEQDLEFFRLTEWESETERLEPACGGVFQPYGAIEASNTCNLAAQVVLKALLRPQHVSSHHIWSCSTQRLVELGGRWTADAVSLLGDSASIAGVRERPWIRRVDCLGCGGGQ